MADYIDREATIDKLTMLFPLLKRRTIKNILKAVPSADVRENVHGHWIYAEGVHVYGVNSDIQLGSYRCSACGNCSPHMTNFCPNCGARMDGKCAN